MDWDAFYIISGSLRLEISPAGKLVLSGSPSRKPQEAQLDSIPVLLGFATGARPRDVFNRLQQDWEIDEAGFAEVVEAMADQELLVPAGGEEGPPLPDQGFGSVRAHFVMLKDLVRVLSYRSAIERHARGRNVVEIGCGTGVLSLFAARAGARRVTAIEQTRISQVAARMFAANGCSEVIDLRVANSRDVELDEPADLLIHEILGVDPFEENLLPYLDDARRRLLRPGGRFLPYRLEVCCMGIELEEPPPSGEDLTLAEAKELPGVYGLDFGPFLEALADARPRPATSRTWLEGTSRFGPRLLSEEQRFLDIDFARDSLDFDGHTATIPLRIIREGSLEGVVVFFRAHLDEHIQLTTSPLAPPTSWGWSLRHFSKRRQVVPGDEVTVAVEFGHRGGAQGLKIDLV